MDWNQLLRDHLQALIRIDTTNPPGNETAAAEYVAHHLAGAGIASEILEPILGRGSVIGRIKGDGSLRPLLLLSHLDVVPAVAKDWTYGPFDAEEVDGAIYGRGAVDCKNLVATWLTLMQKLKAENVPLRRDVIFAATADEEVGGYHGLKWIVDNRWDLIDAEFALNEGGGNALKLGGKTYFTYQAGEKTSCRVELVARGTAGHASISTPDNPLYKLAHGLDALSRVNLPYHATTTVEAFLNTLAVGLGGIYGQIIRWAVRTGQVPRIVALAVQSPFERAGLRAMISNTATPTMLSAGQKINVIPSEARAQLDGRILPGCTADDLVRELKAVLPININVEVGPSGEATESPIETPLATVIKETITRHSPGSVAIPFLSPGATDARFLRPKGMVVYGFCPMLPGEKVNLAHGVNEHLRLESLNFGFAVLEDVVKKMVM